MIYQKQTASDPRLPFYIFRHCKNVSRHRGSLQNWHENIELLFVRAGQGEVSIDEDTLPLQAGDIAVINSGRIHRVVPTGEEDMRYDVLIIDRSFCLENHMDTSLMSFCPLFRDYEMDQLMDKLLEAYEGQAPFRVQTVRAAALGLLAALGRHCQAEASPPTDTSKMAHIKQALEYIHARSHQDISLDQLAAVTGLSKYYFVREFKRITGFGLVDYIHTLRCEKAKQLLITTRRSIDEISRTCGFSGRSYFTRVFTKHTGLSPAAYRKASL